MLRVKIIVQLWLKFTFWGALLLFSALCLRGVAGVVIAIFAVVLFMDTARNLQLFYDLRDAAEAAARREEARKRSDPGPGETRF